MINSTRNAHANVYAKSGKKKSIMKKTPKKNTLIKSRQRVRDHGEVFTPEHIVKDMCNLIPQDVRSAKQIERRMFTVSGEGRRLPLYHSSPKELQ